VVSGQAPIVLRLSGRRVRSTSEVIVDHSSKSALGRPSTLLANTQGFLNGDVHDVIDPSSRWGRLCSGARSASVGGCVAEY
jgi:hypothetical protein